MALYLLEILVCWQMKQQTWQTELSCLYICYVDPVNNQVKEVYLGLVEIQDNKGAEALCQKICEVFCAKGLDIKQLIFMDLMELMPCLVIDQAYKGDYVMKHLIQNM